MKISLADSFVHKLNEQIKFISKDKPGAARKFKKDIFEKINELSKLPYKNRKSIYFEDERIRDLIFKGYTIVYLIEKETIYVFGFIKSEETL